MFTHFLSLLSIVLLHLAGNAYAGLERLPKKIYGVNLGSWLVLEPWMLPQEWQDMGGQACNHCSDCIASEFELVKANPKTADAIFNKHWSTWFAQSDVDELKSLGINFVRIPLGYWLVEGLVDRRTEYYARGGIKQLRRGLQQLNKAGIVAILDHHALPGTQDPQQQFTGHCTDDVEFYTPYNYHRALVWTAVMTAISHLDSAFQNVIGIQAVNEPIMDSSKTPGYGEFQKNFVLTIRAVELALGIPFKGHTLQAQGFVDASANFTGAMAFMSTSVKVEALFNLEVASVLADALPLLLDTVRELGLMSIINIPPSKTRTQLIANFMDVNWQWGDSRSNPKDAELGPQAYDNHLYYSFGGVADANEEAYMRSICNLDRVESDAALGNTPLWFGEWGLPTQFNATDEFLNKWADAQKLAYSKGAGWVFWNFKIEKSALAGDTARQWSYVEGVRLGYLTKDPAALHDPHVCDAYIGPPPTTTTEPTTDPTTTTDPTGEPTSEPTTEPTTTASATESKSESESASAEPTAKPTQSA